LMLLKLYATTSDLKLPALADLTDEDESRL